MFLALAGLAIAAVPLAAQHPGQWLATWAPSYTAAPPAPPRWLAWFDPVPTYADRTFRQVVHTTVGGDRVRIRLTNEYGREPLVIGAAHIAVRDSGAVIRAATGRAITFGGRPSVTLAPGAVTTSDAVDMRVPALGDIAVSLWITGAIRAATRHSNARQENYLSPRGDYSAATTFAPDMTTPHWLWLAGVDVVNAAATGVIVAFGNSITDGDASTPNTNGRWPDALARRLLSSTEPAKGVVNAGISGNRLLAAGMGPSALARFERDVLGLPGVTHVVVMLGINDLLEGTGQSEVRDAVSAEDIVGGYRQLIARAHERGLVIYGATLTPIGGLTRPTVAAVDAKRRAVNRWIRTSGAFDGVIDFDAATRDPARPERLLPAFDSGDHVHPSDAGYRAMGASIDLALFRRTGRKRASHHDVAAEVAAVGGQQSPCCLRRAPVTLFP